MKVVDVMIMRKINIMCLQKTRQVGKKAKTYQKLDIKYGTQEMIERKMEWRLLWIKAKQMRQWM